LSPVTLLIATTFRGLATVCLPFATTEWTALRIRLGFEHHVLLYGRMTHIFNGARLALIWFDPIGS
jgi:hypothetical protein